MQRIYGLQTDKENINLIVNGDKALITMQTAENFEARELKLQFDNEELEEIPAIKLKSYGFSSDYDGAKISSTNKEKQPEPVQRALNRVKELKYITDVRIDEEFETTVDGFPENRLTITIDYLDVDLVEEARKADKYKELEI